MFTNHSAHNHSPPPSSVTTARRMTRAPGTPLPIFPTLPTSRSQTPEDWWSHFINCTPNQDCNFNNEEIFNELSKAIEMFPVDQHKNDSSMLRIWLAYIETHWKLNNDVDEFRRMFKYLKSMHIGISRPELFLYWAQFEYSQGNIEKAASVLKNGLEYIRKDNKLDEALRLLGEGQFIQLEPLIEFKKIVAIENFDNKENKEQPIIDMEVTETLKRVDDILNKQEPLVDTVIPSEMTEHRRIKRAGLGPPKRVTIDETITQKDETHVQYPMTPITGPENNRRESRNDLTIQANSINIEEESKSSRSIRVNGKQYKVLQVIGKGGSSKVFRVMDANGELFALKKVSLKNLDEFTLQGYINEIELLESFAGDEHIIKLIDSELNQSRSCLYVIMEYGEIDLSTLLKQSPPTPTTNLSFIRYIFHQMLLSVQTVHSRKIVHCDLKPANFLLVRGKLKLIDFGISKAIQNDTTNVVRENQVGTVNYMSPEALRESANTNTVKGRIKIGRQSDVWSLGCILYEMIFGAPPFAKFTLIQRLQCITDDNHNIEYPIDTSSQIPTALMDIIKGCLKRNVKERYTIEQLLQHPFLNPELQSSQSIPLESLLKSDQVIVSKNQIRELLTKFKEIHPALDADYWTIKIFEQWKQEINNQT